MERAYMIAGKRFKARDEADLNDKLKPYGLRLIKNNDVWAGVKQTSSERSYDVEQSFGDSADVRGYDVVVGRRINSQRDEDVQVINVSDLEIALKEVREDMPDSEILFGSCWV